MTPIEKELAEIEAQNNERIHNYSKASVIHACLDVRRLIEMVRCERHNYEHCLRDMTRTVRANEAQLAQREAQLNTAVKALEDTSVRLNFLRHHTACIGINLAHVDGNCTHCSTMFFNHSIEQSLAEIGAVGK